MNEWRSRFVPAWALLPLRIFFGVTFLYAGLDKLLDPAFFDSNSAESIQGQFQIFERSSPLAPLVHIVEPYSVALGILIALAEVAVGIGVLTGLAYRVAALSGAVISLLFFLTASWTTHPYYFGNDLPYAFGWLTLALAGHGNLLVLPLARLPADVERPVDERRRGIVQVGVLALAALFVGSGAALLRFIRNEPSPASIGSGPGPSPSPSSRPTPSSTATAEPSTSPTGPASAQPSTAGGGLAIGTVAAVHSAGSMQFIVPITAPAPLPAGDPGVVVALADGTFAAYDALCTHEGCRVNYNSGARILACPCHGAEFDPADHAKVLAGPAQEPLLELPLVVNKQDGTIALAVS